MVKMWKVVDIWEAVQRFEIGNIEQQYGQFGIVRGVEKVIIWYEQIIFGVNGKNKLYNK